MENNPLTQQSQISTTQTEISFRTPELLIADYEEGANQLAAAVAGMSHQEIRARPIAGKWSTLEVVCHVADCEQFFADRMKRTLAMNRPLLVGADGWLYPDAVCYHNRDLEEELSLVALTRRQMARILKHAPEEGWERTAVHTELGLVTVRQLFLHAIRHLQHHITFIEQKHQALAETGPNPSSRPTLSVHGRDTHEVDRKGDYVISTDPRRLDFSLIHDFLANRSYWAIGRPLDVVRHSLENSLCFGLYEKGQQIGLARVITDRATFAWLCDVFVLEEHRGKGLAKWLIECVVGHPILQGLRRIVLGTQDAHGLYQRYGFTPLANPTRWMEIFRPNGPQESPADRERE